MTVFVHLNHLDLKAVILKLIKDIWPPKPAGLSSWCSWANHCVPFITKQFKCIASLYSLKLFLLYRSINLLPMQMTRHREYGWIRVDNGIYTLTPLLEKHSLIVYGSYNFFTPYPLPSPPLQQSRCIKA